MLCRKEEKRDFILSCELGLELTAITIAMVQAVCMLQHKAKVVI
jgi:hypothetical protein